MRRLLIALPLLLLAAACGGDEGDVAENDLPPELTSAIIPEYEADLAALGLRLTDRGGLIDRSDGYERSPAGDHLALYVEPIADDYDLDDYLDNVVAVTALLAPDLFEEYPGLQSFDICQEPSAADDPRAEPSPVTQLEMTRAQVEAVDWDSFDLEELRQRSIDGGMVYLNVSAEIAATDRWQTALEE